MSATDWIALVGVVVSVVAFAIAARAYQLQKRSQGTSDEGQLNDLVEKIQDRLAGMGGSLEVTMKSFSADNAALAGVQGLALEARKLSERAGIEPDWFQSMVLATAFGQVWDLAGAAPYLRRAVDIAKTHQSRIRSLTSRAMFYYMRGQDADLELARQDFKTARDELRKDPDQQGPDLATEQAAALRLAQAECELMMEHRARAVDLVVDAFLEANTLHAAWRRKRAVGLALAFVLEQQIVPTHELLPSVRAALLDRDARPDSFPDNAKALFMAPADSSAASGSSAPGQPAGLYGAGT
jgi:hypothetical protein